MEEVTEEGMKSGEVSEKDNEKLAETMDGRLVVSADKIDWVKVGQFFKYAALFKLANSQRTF